MFESLHRVLVVDDNEATRRLIGRILQQELPIDPVLAGSAKEARRKLSRHRYDLILLDLLMPDSSGFEVLEFARSAQSCNRTTTVMVISVLDDAESMARCRALGASYYIVKPVLRESLKNAVREQLERLSPRTDENYENGKQPPRT